MIIYNYEDFNKNYYINKNRDYISTEMFIKNSKKYNYDSFIFGSSTALYTPPSIWQDYINTQNNIFSFDASGERLPGIWSKIKYLDKNGIKIKNALINFENETFKVFINNVPIYMKHNEIFPSSGFYFQYASFANFCNLEFLVALVHYKIRDKYYPYMSDFLIKYPYYYDTLTNEYYNTGIIDEFRRDSVNYYEIRKNKFPERSGIKLEEESKIDFNHIQMLSEIRDILVKQNTNFKVIICPTYNQREFNHDDLRIIKAIFYESNVFDFTGINRFTKNKSLYYDEFHFKKYLGKELLDSVYFDNSQELF